MDLVRFLGREQSDLTVSCIRLSDELQLVAEVDRIFQVAEPRLAGPPEGGEDTHAPFILFMFVRNQLYNGVTALLRGHRDVALGVLRRAIEAALSAFWIRLHPESEAAYLQGEKPFGRIKRVFQRLLDEEPETPHAREIQGLIEAHQVCSAVGSHADLTGMAPRIDVTGRVDAPLQVGYSFFDELSVAERAVSLLWVLEQFLRMLVLFDDVFREHGGRPIVEWGPMLTQTGMRLEDRKMHIMQGG